MTPASKRICVWMRGHLLLQSDRIQRHCRLAVLNCGESEILETIPGIAIEPECPGGDFFRFRADGDYVSVLWRRLSESGLGKNCVQEHQQYSKGYRNSMLFPAVSLR